MGCLELIALLGDEIEDVDEEIFYVFSQFIPSQGLGFVDSQSVVLEMEVAGKDYTIHQSPTLLSSDRAGGTTGAVLWKINPLVADWMCAKDNILFRKSVLETKSVILELGCGTSGLPGMAIAPRIGRYVATDQNYVLKLLRRNLEENSVQLRLSSRQQDSLPAKPSPPKRKPPAQMDFVELDWELSDPSSLSASLRDSSSSRLNAILACDCIYNDMLIEPLVRTCAELCSQELIERLSGSTLEGPICVIAQQLRSPEVFQGWLTEFHRRFRVWRFPDSLLTDGLRQGSGYVIYGGLVRNLVS